MISPYAKQGFIDHQTLSFDAYLKFIEDVFLGGQRLDPATDGRPDPRPDVREDVPAARRPANDFDFNQQPRPPVILPVNPQTDLITPARAARRHRAAGRTLGAAPQRAAALLRARGPGSSVGDDGEHPERGVGQRRPAAQHRPAHDVTVAALRRAVLSALRDEVTRAVL